jgi:hypothetical protein
MSRLADDAYRVFAICQAIGYGFWQHDFATFPESAHGIADDPARTGVLLRLRGERDKPVILVARQHGEIVTAGSADELDIALCTAGLCHGSLSHKYRGNIAAVSDRVNCDGVALHREQDAPVSRAQPHSGAPLSAFTLPIPVSANGFSLVSICARVVAVSLRH